MCFFERFFGFSCFRVFGFLLDAKKYEKKLNGNCSSKKKFVLHQEEKKHENMKTPKPEKIDAKTQKLVLKTHSV